MMAVARFGYWKRIKVTLNQLPRFFTKKHQETHRTHNSCATAASLFAARSGLNGFSHAVSDRFWRRFCPLTPSQEQTKPAEINMCVPVSAAVTHQLVTHSLMNSCKTGYFKYANSGKKLAGGKKKTSQHTSKKKVKREKNNPTNPSVSQIVGEKSQCSLSEHVQGQRWVWNGENGWKKVREMEVLTQKKKWSSLLIKRPSVKKKRTASGWSVGRFFFDAV